MKTWKKCIIGTILPILASCQNGEEQTKTINFTRDNFKNTVTLSNPQEIILENPQITNPASFHLLRDSLIIVQNQPSGNSLLDLFSLNSNKFISQLATKGRGPGEFISLRLTVNPSDGNQFYATDSRKYYTIDIDSTIKNKRLYILDSIKCSNPNLHSYMSILPIDKSSYVGYNLWYINKSEYNVNKTPQISIYHNDTTMVQNSPTTEQNKFFPGPVNGATMFMNPKNKQIWLADWHTAEINIYDSSLNLVKTLVGPDSYNLEYSTMETPTLTMVMFANNKTYRTYSSFTYTKDFVYIIYEGVNGVNAKDFESNQLPYSEIFKFSWNGELISNYKLDRYVISISVSSDEKYFYCTSKDTLRGEIHLLKYTL